MAWVIGILVLIAFLTITSIIFSNVVIKGYFYSHQGKISLEIRFLRFFMLKIVIFECKGNLYYQIGKRDFQRIKLNHASESIDKIKPSSKDKINFLRLLPIRLNSLHVNLSYCASNVWSATFRPFVEAFGGIIDYYYRRLVICDDTYIVINDATARLGFLLSIAVSVKMSTILSMLAKTLIFNAKSRAKQAKIRK